MLYRPRAVGSCFAQALISSSHAHGQRRQLVAEVPLLLADVPVAALWLDIGEVRIRVS